MQPPQPPIAWRSSVPEDPTPSPSPMMMGARNVPLWLLANIVRERQKPDEDRIYAAFGRFVASYALAKSGLHIAARHFSGMPDDKAQIVFSGMRQADLIDKLRPLVSAEKAAEINAVIDHLVCITEVINQFVHRITEYEHGKGLSVTNKLTCRSRPDAQPRLFSLKELEFLEYDCRVIFDRFILACDSALRNGVYTGISFVGLCGPWQYKPPQQEKNYQPNRGGRELRKRQPRASRQSRRPDASE